MQGLQTSPSTDADIVLRKPLALFSEKPMTGYYRTGSCQVGPDDTGNHSIAGMSSTDSSVLYVEPPY